MKATNKEMSVRKFWTSNELLDAVSARKAVSIGMQRGDALRTALRELRAPELLALLANVEVSRVAKIVAISTIDDVDLLLAIAANETNAANAFPQFVRRDALHRIDELCDRTPLDPHDARRLVPCLDEKDLVAFAVALMDMSDYDWPVHGDVTTVGALCQALYDCTSMHETVLLEDARAHLMHRRPDLESNISACSPEQYPLVA